MAIVPGTDVNIEVEPLPRGPITDRTGTISRVFFNWFQGKDRKLGEIISGVNRNRQNIVQLETDYQAADGTLSSAYIAADAVVFANSEASNATLSTNLTAAFQAADTTVTNAYIAADSVVSSNASSALASATTSLTAAYQAADSTLQGQITTNAGNISTAQANITTLQSTTATNTSAISTLTTNLSAEVTNRTNADTALQGQITTNAAAISTEATARASGDAAEASARQTLTAEVKNPQANLISNSTGAKGLDGWTVGAGIWFVGDGADVGRYIATSTAGTLSIRTPTFPVFASSSFTFGINAGGTGFTSGSVAFVWFDSSNNVISTTGSVTIVPDVAYPRLTGTATAPAGAVSACLEIGCVLTSGFLVLFQAKAEIGSVSTTWRDDAHLVGVSSSITTLQSTTATNTSAISTLTTNLSAEVTNRTNADTALQGQITTNAGNITTNAAAITTEATARASGDSANAALITTLEAKVDTKARTFVQTSAPSATATGDLWVDSDDDNKLYRWNGSSWVAVDDGRIATKARTFAQNSAPTASATGDLWVDTDDDNKLYRWNGSSWVASDDGRISTISASVSNIAEAYATNDSAKARLVWEVNTSTNVATIEQTAATGFNDGTWNGSAIKLSADLIELLAEDINFGSNTTYEDTYATLYTEKNSKRLRILGPFPAADDLVLWFGPTSVSLNSETKTNGHFCLATDGKIYLGSAELTNSGNLDFTYTNGFVKTRIGNGTNTSDSVSFTGSGGSGSGYTFAHELIVTYTTGPTVTLSNSTGSPITASATGVVGDEVRFFVQTTMTDSAGNKVTKSKGGGLFWDI